MKYSIGLMSGTSMDGIDAALLKTDGTPSGLESLAFTSLAYSPACRVLLKATEYTVRQSEGDMQLAQQNFSNLFNAYLVEELQLSGKTLKRQLDALDLLLEEHHGLLRPYAPRNDERSATENSVLRFDTIEDSTLRSRLTLAQVIELSTHLHAQAVKQLLDDNGLTADDIDVIGYHGQTLYHKPEKQCSVIVGDGQLLTQLTGITVVNDFRRNDIEAGGQGAPFAPLYHHALAVRDKRLPLAIVNCGGIANITIISNDDENTLLGFDTGPGNALLDSLVRQYTQGQQSMDLDGQFALKGKVNDEVLNALYKSAMTNGQAGYFDLPPPKSLDYGDMQLIPELTALSIENACRTLAAFTADSIVKSLQWCDVKPMTWVLAGGGWNNPVIVEELSHRLQTYLGDEVEVLHADAIGWSNAAMEAELFAYLAVRSLNGLPLSLPGTTNVPKPMTGGEMYTI